MSHPSRSSAQSSMGQAAWATHPFLVGATSSRLPLACGPHFRPHIPTEVFGVHLSLLPVNFQPKATSESWLRGMLRQCLHSSWFSSCTSFIPVRDMPEIANVLKPVTAKGTGSFHSAEDNNVCSRFSCKLVSFHCREMRAGKGCQGMRAGKPASGFLEPRKPEILKRTSDTLLCTEACLKGTELLLEARPWNH